MHDAGTPFGAPTIRRDGDVITHVVQCHSPALPRDAPDGPGAPLVEIGCCFGNDGVHERIGHATLPGDQILATG